MKKYYYKTRNYDYWFNQWLAKDPMRKFEDEHPEWSDTYFYEHNPDDPLVQLWYQFVHDNARAIRAWEKRQPQLEVEEIDVKYVYIDLVTGAPTARKLLLHVKTRNKYPLKVIMDVLKSQRAHHKHRGPYYHSIKINIYPEDMRAWAQNFKTMEVDLWQENIRAAAGVAEKLWAEAFTAVQIRKVFRY